MANIKLISIWKKRKDTRPGYVKIQAAVEIDGRWFTKHIEVEKSDPILRGGAQ